MIDLSSVCSDMIQKELASRLLKPLFPDYFRMYMSTPVVYENTWHKFLKRDGAEANMNWDYYVYPHKTLMINKKEISMNVEVEHYEDGTLKFVQMRDQNGLLHNDNGPARQLFNPNGRECSREYFIHGHQHREDGPAHQRWGSSGNLASELYFLEGEYLSKKDWERRVKGVKVEANGKTVYISLESAEAMDLF